MTAAAESMGIPADLVSRSAAARATANGTTTDDIVAAWAGGAAVATSAPSEPASPAATVETAPAAAEPAVEVAPPPLAPVIQQTPVADAPVLIEEDEPMEPVDLSDRLRTAGRVGVWTGAILGLFAFVMAAAAWSQNVSVTGEESLRPVFVADSQGLLIGVGLVSVIFGAVVASFARAAAAWTNPAMQLAAPRARTAWIGAALGLMLGLAAGAILANGIGTAIEGSEGLVELPVLPTFAVMVVGGALLGWLTTLLTQFFGVPVAVDESDAEEVAAVRSRLGNAIGIPAAGMMLLLALVLPFAWTLIESNHLTSGGAAIIAIVAASGILAFASLAGTKPNMKISRGELMVAIAGIGLVILMIFAVLTNLGGEDHSEDTAGEASITQLIS